MNDPTALYNDGVDWIFRVAGWLFAGVWIFALLFFVGVLVLFFTAKDVTERDRPQATPRTPQQPRVFTQGTPVLQALAGALAQRLEGTPYVVTTEPDAVVITSYADGLVTFDEDDVELGVYDQNLVVRLRQTPEGFAREDTITGRGNTASPGEVGTAVYGFHGRTWGMSLSYVLEREGAWWVKRRAGGFSLDDVIRNAIADINPQFGDQFTKPTSLFAGSSLGIKIAIVFAVIAAVGGFAFAVGSIFLGPGSVFSGDF